MPGGVIGFPWPPMSASSISYVNGGTPMTVAALMSTYPANAANKGKYANVTDLYGSVDEVMRCRYDGTAYRWVPQRESMTGLNAAVSGTINLVPLVTPPTLRLTGTLGGNITITPSATNAYNGQKFRVVNQSPLQGLFTMVITGLLGSNLTLLNSTARDIEYGSSGWFNSN